MAGPVLPRPTGAHLWVHTKDRPQVVALREIDAASPRRRGPYRTAPVTLLLEEGRKAPAALRAMPVDAARGGQARRRGGRLADLLAARRRGRRALLRQGARASAWAAP
ncbi:hypothetical protein [Nonomuraea dietziae]|uniref:hypothetical protein n=1 Tax=Nonomuraea dietziae TaxID=65515 RepID=UPI0031E0D097